MCWWVAKNLFKKWLTPEVEATTNGLPNLPICSATLPLYYASSQWFCTNFLGHGILQEKRKKLPLLNWIVFRKSSSTEIENLNCSVFSIKQYHLNENSVYIFYSNCANKRCITSLRNLFPIRCQLTFIPDFFCCLDLVPTLSNLGNYVSIRYRSIAENCPCRAFSSLRDFLDKHKMNGLLLLPVLPDINFCLFIQSVASLGLWPFWKLVILVKFFH